MTTLCSWRIPYGVADFVKLRTRGHYFVDKTRYLPLLEQAGEYIFLIRPRRFGKSLLQSVMACYYDRNREAQFDELFHDTWIHANPTEERHSYLVLRFDFSMVDSASAELQQSFDDHIRLCLSSLFVRYSKWLPTDLAAKVLAETRSDKRLECLFAELRDTDLPLYLFIDEYDNFANNLLVAEGRNKYQELTHGSGFFRIFLKKRVFPKNFDPNSLTAGFKSITIMHDAKIKLTG